MALRHRTENPGVDGSIPPLPTTFLLSEPELQASEELPGCLLAADRASVLIGNPVLDKVGEPLHIGCQVPVHPQGQRIDAVASYISRSEIELGETGGQLDFRARDITGNRVNALTLDRKSVV